MGIKQKLMEQLASIQAQLAHCDCDSDSPVFIPKEDEDYHYIDNLGNATTTSEDSSNYNGHTFAAFRDSEAADAYAEAFETLLNLRTQKGVVPMKHGTWQFLIEAKGDGSRVEVRKRRDGGVKQSRCFSPAFDTPENASKAIDVIGRENLVKAMKTLAWG